MMRTSLLLAAVAAAAVALPAGASSSSRARSGDPAQDFGSCAVKHYEGAELLATQPGSPEEAEVLAEYSQRGCTAPSRNSVVLRGSVAEQLFKADFGSIGANARRDLLEVFTVDEGEMAALDAATRHRLDLVGFGSCVAAAEPIVAAGLLKTTPGSAAEARVIAQLQPEFSPCLLQGERLSTARAELRGALAEGAYRLALAHALDGEIVVTATRDPSRKVVCKMLGGGGSLVRRKACLTEAQWKTQDNENKIAALDYVRKTMESEEQRMLVEVQSRYQGGN